MRAGVGTDLLDLLVGVAGLETTDEWVCTFKTSALALEPLKTVLRETQGYMGFTTPEIVAVPIESGDADYLAWIDAETARAATSST